MNEHNFGVRELSKYLGLVDDKLLDLAPRNIKGASRLLNARGKRLRPSLLIAVAHHSGRNIDEDVIGAATAVELVHLACLVHDDIMDNGSVRWGVPTINSKEGVSTAILAGDYFLSVACELTVGIDKQAGKIMTGTIAALCEGQAIEINDRFNFERSYESIESAAIGKTSTLFMAASELGGLLSGLSAEKIKMLKDFSRYFGIAYQYKNDLEDIERLKKPIKVSESSDIEEGNYTLPVVHALKSRYGSKLIELLEKTDINKKQVLDILSKNSSVEYVEKVINQNIQKCGDCLREYDNKQLSRVLSDFVYKL